jgi:transposase
MFIISVLEHQGKIYTEIAPKLHRKVFFVDTRNLLMLQSILYGWRGYDELVDLSFDLHYRAHHNEN